MIIPKNFDEQISKFETLLKKFNSIHSLTNYKNIKPIVQDSIDGLKLLPKYPKIAIDIGSGAGFPAIFAAMIFEYSKWYLFEPNAKKSAFLTYVKVTLGLKNVEICPVKIQDKTPFIADTITSRALCKTKELLQISSGFYDENTTFLLYKGSNVSDEIDGLKAKIYKGVDENRNYLILKGMKCLGN